MESTSSAYLPRLDHLRFLAALMVFSWHSLHYLGAVPFAAVPAFPLSLFEEGHTGVSLFITLSGFVFAALCSDRDILYGPFIRNRLLRVGPLLLIWTLIYFYTSTTLTPERMFAMLFGLLVNAAQFPGAGWTVLVEFQCYLLLPFLLVFIRRYGLSYLLGVLATTLLLRTLLYYKTGDVFYVSYYTIFGRIDQFVLGILAYHVYKQERSSLHPVVLVAMVTVWMFVYHQLNRIGGAYGTTYRGVWVFVPTVEGLFYGAIIVAYLRTRLTLPNWLDAGWAWLGKISYSLYLNHDAVVVAGGNWARRIGYPVDTPERALFVSFVVELPIIIAISAVTFYVVEQPFLQLRRPYLVTPAEHMPRAIAQPQQRAAS